MLKTLVELSPDFLVIAGGAVATVGLWWIYPPAALIGGGLGLLFFGLAIARRAAP